MGPYLVYPGYVLLVSLSLRSGDRLFTKSRALFTHLSSRLALSSLEILAYEPTELGILCLRRRELLGESGTIVTEVTLDHEFLMSSYLVDSEQALARVAIEMHGGDALDVLVGGLGLGYTAHEALAGATVKRLEVVEFLPQVIDWLDRGLVPLAKELKGNERLSIIQGDVYARLTQPQISDTQYDLILIDVDHSPDDCLGDASAGFYTSKGLTQARGHLAAGGVLGVWSSAESSPFADAMRSVFDEVRIEQVTVWNPLIDEEQTDWLFFGQ
ncbi:MAG: spermidine synthase [Aeoliella sp.]